MEHSLFLSFCWSCVMWLWQMWLAACGHHLEAGFNLSGICLQFFKVVFCLILYALYRLLDVLRKKKIQRQNGDRAGTVSITGVRSAQTLRLFNTVCLCCWSLCSGHQGLQCRPHECMYCWWSDVWEGRIKQSIWLFSIDGISNRYQHVCLMLDMNQLSWSEGKRCSVSVLRRRRGISRWLNCGAQIPWSDVLKYSLVIHIGRECRRRPWMSCSRARCAFFPAYSGLHVFINVCNLVPLHLLVTATGATGGWLS